MKGKLISTWVVLTLGLFSCGVIADEFTDAENSLKSSVHRNLGCDECHQLDRQAKTVSTDYITCGICHTAEAAGYAKSPHVKGRDISVEDVPTCQDCHGSHDIENVQDPHSRTSHLNSVAICIKCHEDDTRTKKFDMLPESEMIVAYENSVHGQALLKDGNENAPACIDCHGSHTFLPADDPESPVYKTHIAATCGHCHVEIAEHYTASVHGTALAKGVIESPTCTDCHGEHNIKKHLDPDSKVFAVNIPKTCSACHTSEKVVAKYGLKADRIATFKESFHGIAVELGEARAANCASCHGVHDIFPQSDPRSMIYKDNIGKTCGQCHDDLPEDFVQGMVHTSAEDQASGGKFYVRKFYWWFISILIIGFVIYRILEYKRRAQRVEK